MAALGRLLASLVFLACLAPTARAGAADDTARFLAGMPVPSASPLAPLTEAPGWQQHSNAFNAAFKRVDDRQFSKIRAWAKANLAVRRATLFYFFSGPDFLYANAFFPNAKTYVLAGLEPVGAIPDVSKLPKAAVSGALRSLQVSIKSIMSLSFFRTIDMKVDLKASPVNGTLPVIYVFLARSGKVVRDVTLVRLAADGSVHPDGEPDQPKGARGAKITFSSPGGSPQTLYYFSANLANDGFKKAGFAQFCEKLGEANAFVKSASYLMHSGGFSQVRGFLLKQSASILQDDTGIPVTYFGPQWDLRPFGVYTQPISLFSEQYQPKLSELYRSHEKSPINFGLGYRWQQNASNLLLAVKKAGEAPTKAEEPTGATDAPPAKAEGAQPKTEEPPPTAEEPPGPPEAPSPRLDEKDEKDEAPPPGQEDKAR